MIKNLILFAMLTNLALVDPVIAQTKKEKEVEHAVEALRKAMIDPDSSTLDMLTFPDQTIKIIDKTAIVHHTLSAKTNDRGKPGTVKLAVMYTWVKQKQQWKLLARQAVRPT